MAGWEDTEDFSTPFDTGSWDSGGSFGAGLAGGGGGATDPALLDHSGNPILPPTPPEGGDPDRTWGQQFGDWLGISDSSQTKMAKVAKELKSELGNLKLNQLADPNAPKPGQVSAAGGPPPSAARPAASLDELLQRLYQRRQQLSQLGLSGKPWQPRGPGGGLLGSA